MGRTATERLEQLADDLGLTAKQRRLGAIIAAQTGLGAGVPEISRTQAARQAGYSPWSAHVEATRTLKLDSVKTFVTAARAELMKNGRRNPVADAQEILEFHSRVMRGNMADFLTEDATGKVRVDPSKVSRRKARLIKEITIGPDGEIRGLKLQSAQVSADRLAKHLGLYSDDDSSRHLQTALTLGALVGSLPEQERSDLARRLMGPVIDVARTEVPATVDVTPKDSDR